MGTQAERIARRLIGLTRHRTRRGALWRVDVTELCELLGCKERTLWKALKLAERLVVRSRAWDWERGGWVTYLGRRLPVTRTRAGQPRHVRGRGRAAAAVDPAAPAPAPAPVGAPAPAPAAVPDPAAAPAAAAGPTGTSSGGRECTPHYRAATSGRMVPVPGTPAPPAKGMVWAMTRRILAEVPDLQAGAALAAHWLARHGATPKAYAALLRGARRAVADATDAAMQRLAGRWRGIATADWLRATAHAERYLGERPERQPWQARAGKGTSNKPAAAPGGRAFVEEPWKPAPAPVEQWRPDPAAVGGLRAAMAAALAGKI